MLDVKLNFFLWALSFFQKLLSLSSLSSPFVRISAGRHFPLKPLCLSLSSSTFVRTSAGHARRQAQLLSTGALTFLPHFASYLLLLSASLFPRKQPIHICFNAGHARSGRSAASRGPSFDVFHASSAQLGEARCVWRHEEVESWHRMQG